MLDSAIAACFSPGLAGLCACAFYVIFVGTIFSFFVLYMKRMITVGFLVMIAPLITITYSIDKIGDNKAQALNSWLKEFSYNILIQPFHCIIYLTFFDAIGKMVEGSDALNINAWIFAIVVLMFMKKAEEILRKIFHFDASSMSSLKESGQSIANATGKFAKIGMAAGGAISSFKAAGGMQNIRDTMGNYKANKQLRSEFKNDNKGFSSFKEYKNSEQGQERFKNIKAEQMKSRADKKTEERKRKVEERARKNYDAKFGEGAYDKILETSRKTDENGNPTDEAKRAQAILDSQNSKAREQLISEGEIKEPKIKGPSKVGKAFSNMRTGVSNFMQDSGLGNSIKIAAKDSVKVASAIALGGFALGASGQMNDAISAGQLGFGLAKGIMENSQKTVVQDGAEDMAKYLQKNGMDANETQNVIDMASAMKKSGQLEASELDKKFEELRNKLVSLLGEDRANGILGKLQDQLNNPNLKFNKSEIFAGVSDADISAVEKEFDTYTDRTMLSKIASGIDTARNVTNMDSEEYGRRVQKQVEKMDLSGAVQTINYNTTVQNIKNISQTLEETINQNTYTEERKQQIYRQQIQNISNQIQNIDKTTIENTQVENTIQNIENIVNTINQAPNSTISDSQINSLRNEINNLNTTNQ